MNYIILYGTLWGIFEATFGYLLHLLTFSIGWLFWAPFAFLFMHLTYLKTEKKSSILCVALLSASIKLVNLPFSPRLDKVINPSVSIILEGLAMFVSVVLFEKKYKVLKSITYNTLWRVFYIIFICLTPWINASSSLLTSSSELISHLITKNIFSTLLLFMILKIESKLKNIKINFLINKYTLVFLLIISILLELTL